MSSDRARHIESLAAEIEPRRGLRSVTNALPWWLASACLIALWMSPMRPGFAQQWLDSPHFLFETLLGAAAGLALIKAAFDLGVPDPLPGWRRAGAALVLLVTWVGVQSFGLVHPALEPSMLGKREGCNVETFLLSLPALGLGLAMMRRFAPLARVETGALLGAAAAAIPALLMQLGCMYVVDHILVSHFAPGLLTIALGALLGPVVLRKI